MALVSAFWVVILCEKNICPQELFSKISLMVYRPQTNFVCNAKSEVSHPLKKMSMQCNIFCIYSPNGTTEGQQRFEGLLSFHSILSFATLIAPSTSKSNVRESTPVPYCDTALSGESKNSLSAFSVSWTSLSGCFPRSNRGNPVTRAGGLITGEQNLQNVKSMKRVHCVAILSDWN